MQEFKNHWTLLLFQGHHDQPTYAIGLCKSGYCDDCSVCTLCMVLTSIVLLSAAPLF